MSPDTAASIPYEGADCTPEEAVEAVKAVRATALTACPTHAVCPPCREGWGHWNGHEYVPTIQSEAAKKAVYEATLRESVVAANERAERLALRIVAAEHAVKQGQSATVVLALLATIGVLRFDGERGRLIFAAMEVSADLLDREISRRLDDLR